MGWDRLLPTAWSLALALLLLGPALAPGYVLSYDMVWVPDLALRGDFLGLASSLPRVVPSDAVIAVVDEVVPGMLLQKGVLLGSLVAGGLGAARLALGLPLVGRLATITCYQWSPFVVERLWIGHWPVLVCWACLPWVLALGLRWRASGTFPALLALLVVLGSLSASAGLATSVALVVAAAQRRVRRWVALGGLVAAANAPWVVAGLLHAGSARSDPEGAAVFALGVEGPVPAPIAALSLGGIWNGDVVPDSRAGLAGWLTAVLVVVLAAVGFRLWRTALGPRAAAALGGCWAVGMGLALLTWAAPEAVGWLAARVPGGGVIRDGARMLVLAAPAVATVLGAGAAAVAARVEAGAARRLVGAGLVLLPMLLLADAAWGIGGRLAAVDYPASYPPMRAAVVEAPAGDVLVLPLSSFRRPEWNDFHVVLDPVGRYQPRDYVSSDVLVVAGRTIPGEDRRFAAAVAALAQPTAESRSSALSEIGIGVVVTDHTALGDVPPLAGAELMSDDADFSVLALPGPARDRAVPWSWSAAMALAWAAYLGTAVLTVWLVGLRTVRRRRPRRA